MKTLFLAWQDRGRTRAWFPIGRLDADLAQAHYQFGYVQGALRAHREAGLEPLDSFPSFQRQYESAELFPLFRNRVMNSERNDFDQYLQQLDLDPSQANPLEILAITGGQRQTDNLEVFPKIERHADGGFCCRFFLHGWRHVNEPAQTRLAALSAGDPLRVALEVNNPATGVALQLQTAEDYHMVGWAPRYLVSDLIRAIGEAPAAVSAKVVRVNPAPAPLKQRVLIELNGRFPATVEPMSTPDYQLVNHSQQA